MKRVPASLEDRRMWGRALKSYRGAFGTSRPDDDPEPDGRLCGFIPLTNSIQLKEIWGVLGISKDHPSSAWHRIDEFDDFLLAIDAVKYSRLLVWKFWMCRISFYFQHGLLGRDKLEIAGVKWFCDQSIPDLFLTVDLLLKGDAPPPLPAFARSLL